MSTTLGNRALVWFLLTAAALTNIAGYVWNLYRQFWWFDEVLHGFTIFALTLLLGLLVHGVVLLGARNHGLVLILVVASIGVVIGGLWEMAEWAYEQMVAPNVIKEGGHDHRLERRFGGCRRGRNARLAWMMSTTNVCSGKCACNCSCKASAPSVSATRSWNCGLSR